MADSQPGTQINVRLTVNGVPMQRHTEARTLLVDFLRDDLGLTGTHAGCEQGVCGACTVEIDGTPTRSCLAFAAQYDGAEINTVECLNSADGTLHPIQEAFHTKHGLQCGFCTPGMLMTAKVLLQRNADPSRDEVIEAMTGNLCRCTGYQNIVDSVLEASALVSRRESEGAMS